MTAHMSMSEGEARRLKSLQREQKDETDAKQAVWVFLWTLFVFKVLTIGLIWYAAGGSAESQAIIWATSWAWVIIPALAVVGPFLFWRRKRKQRKERVKLIQSEWMVQGAVPDVDTVRLITLSDALPGSEPPPAR